MIIITKKLRPAACGRLCPVRPGPGGSGGGPRPGPRYPNRPGVAEAGVDPRNVKSNADRIAYLESHGWLVSAEAASVEDIRLPRHL